MSSWWQYEPESKFRVPDVSDPATERAGSAFVLLVFAVLLFLGSFIVGFFFRSWTLALYGMGGSFGLMAISALLLPKSKPRKAQ